MRRGKLITFEGPEGSGKTTHIRRLAGRLRRCGLRVLITREPGGTRTGEIIRRILQHDLTGEHIEPETELFLFEASRAQLVRRVIQPALGKGWWVLCDRFADSTTAYQGYGRGLDLPTVLKVNAVAMGACVPDLTLLLDVPVGKGFGRLAERAGRRGIPRDRLELESPAFHRRVRKGYLALARQHPRRIRLIRTDRPMGEVAREIWRAVQDAFGLQS